MNESKECHFAYDLIRNDVLKDLLGTEHDSLLYWIGKTLARKYPVETLEEAVEFFAKADWGKLELTKERKQEKSYQLEGEWMGRGDDRCYQLEAGFLAEINEQWSNTVSVAFYTVKRNFVQITVHSDRRDFIES
ncbi:YslB family protein [Shouchella shacheensis]|uniref:YslB family protein n=1 Tax=Shouchella shacheensis TaxID=1649580 RepID=UPI0007402826|nr:YslB family protein [Shouchella shacheensis]